MSNTRKGIVIHVDVDDHDTWKHLLNTAEVYHQEAEGNEVELVCEGRGVNLVRNSASPYRQAIAAMMAQGITFVASEYAMSRFQLTKSDMLDGVEIASTGISALARAQQEGLAYYRA
jgi:intracellular sulfur oxidation DsrE/DsrF family protein